MKQTLFFSQWQHPDFIPDVQQGNPNDIAILKLKKDIESEITSPIDVTPQGKDHTSLNCTITGWGDASE